MVASPSRVHRYGELARLLVRHREAFEAVAGGQPPVVDKETRRDAERLASDLEAMGPTFVKLGQLLSTRTDLLPAPHLEALARLQDRVAPFGAGQAREVFRTELGAEVGDAFSAFDDEPMASASLGQVHAAELGNGHRVVVKIQRPGVSEQVASDLEALGEIARAIDAHTDAGRRYGFEDLFDQFRRSVVDELDYRREAANLLQVAGIAAPHPLIAVPRPVAQLTAAQVLTMDRVDGRKVTELGPLARLDVDGDALADALFAVYLDQIFVHGFFHADPHPGNVLVTDDGRLALVDLGMVGMLRTEVRTQLIKLVLALAEGRADDVAGVLVRLGTPLEDFAEDRFRREIASIVGRTRATPLSPSASGAGAGDALGQLSQACGRSGLRPPAELALLVRAVLSLEAVAAALAPGFDPVASLERHSSRIAGSGLMPTQGGVLSALVDARDFAEQLPGRVNRVMDSLARGDLRLKVHAFDEAELLRGLQKLANRLTMGLVIAALVLGAAILARQYPTIALACFLVAAAAGALLLGSMVVGDRHVRARTRRRPPT